LKRFINIVTLIVFLLGTIPYSVIFRYCKMFDSEALSTMEQDSVYCNCGTSSDEEIYFSSMENFCCLTKTIEKDKVDEFSNTKDESVKVISTGFIPFDFLPKIVPSANYSLFYNFKPRLGLKLPLINCSLLI
jgi:hypothetical protein